MPPSRDNVDDDFVSRFGVYIARDCIERAEGLRSLLGESYVEVARKRCDVRGDHGLAFVLDELERRADAGRLGTAEALAAAARELRQDVPASSRALSLLEGLDAGARRYGAQP